MRKGTVDSRGASGSAAAHCWTGGITLGRTEACEEAYGSATTTRPEAIREAADVEAALEVVVRWKKWGMDKSRRLPCL